MITPPPHRLASHYCMPGEHPTSMTLYFSFVGIYSGLDWQACPPGTYNPGTGLTAESECTACDGGLYCATSGLDATTGQCTEGYYCTTGREFVMFLVYV